jgi:small subunit ribosomal protein S3
MLSLVAENIALQLENRISFRRAMKSCMSRTMKSWSTWVLRLLYQDVLAELIWLVQSSTAREQFLFRHFEQILIMDSLKQTQLTVKVGVKVWIYKGEVLPDKESK